MRGLTLLERSTLLSSGSTANIAIRPITAKIAVLANELPSTYPGDPSNRLIVAHGTL